MSTVGPLLLLAVVGPLILLSLSTLLAAVVRIVDADLLRVPAVWRAKVPRGPDGEALVLELRRAIVATHWPTIVHVEVQFGVVKRSRGSRH
jgi:hypothetical protein